MILVLRLHRYYFFSFAYRLTALQPASVHPPTSEPVPHPPHTLGAGDAPRTSPARSLLPWPMLVAIPTLRALLFLPLVAMFSITNRQLWRESMGLMQGISSILFGLMLAVVSLLRHRAMSGILHQAAAMLPASVHPAAAAGATPTGSVTTASTPASSVASVVIKLGVREVHVTRLQSELKTWFQYTFIQAILTCLFGCIEVAQAAIWWNDSLTSSGSVWDISADAPIERLTIADGLVFWILWALAPPILIWGTWPVPPSASIVPLRPLPPPPPAPDPAPQSNVTKQPSAVDALAARLAVFAQDLARAPEEMSASPMREAGSSPHLPLHLQLHHPPQRRVSAPDPTATHLRGGRTQDNVGESAVIVDPAQPPGYAARRAW